MRKISRNDLCPCGSGKKYKHCCLKADEAAAPRAPAFSIPDAIQQGLALHQAGRLAEAEALYNQVLQADPSQPDALHLLGLIARLQGKNLEAIELIRKAINVNSSIPLFHNNLGTIFEALGQLDEAIKCYQKALAIKPDFIEAHSNLGVALQGRGRPLEAAEHCQKAIALRPDFAEAHYNLGNALKDQGRLDEAAECYRRALSFKPDYADAHSNLLFLYSYHALLDPNEYLALARQWEIACLTSRDRETAHNRSFHSPPLTGRRLKVGYVSGDFRQHAVSYFAEQIFANHDRSRVELFAYSCHFHQDAVTERLKTFMDHWIPSMDMSDEALRDRIEADGIDVLIDLSGHTANNRMGVFARRAAPVQACYLGYFASTGLTEMDYWIGDDVLVPPDADAHFSEQVWRLPRVWICYNGKVDAPPVCWQPAPDGTLWLGSFNNLGKLTPQTLALWARILHALPEARLLLKTSEFANTTHSRRILTAFAALGIPGERLELQRESEWAEYMACYNRLDIALDPVGSHGGGVTTCDTLWMGVPLIHLEENNVASRFSTSILNAVGHPEWIARSETEYVDKVVALARNVGLRQTLRPSQRIQVSSSSLCDAKNLASLLEKAYFRMFERWLEKNTGN